MSVGTVALVRKIDPAHEIRQKLVECVVALFKALMLDVIDPRAAPLRDNPRRRSDGRDALLRKFGAGSLHVELVGHEHDLANAFGSQDFGGTHRVLVRVARLGLDPTHGHAELLLERLPHERSFGLLAESDAPGHEDGKCRHACDARAVPHTLERQRPQRVPAVLGSAAADSAAQDHDCLRRLRLREIERGIRFETI